MHSDRHQKPPPPITGSRVRLGRWHNPLARPADKYLPMTSGLMLFLWIALIPFVAAQASAAAAGAERDAAAEAKQLTTAEATLLRATQPRYDPHGLILADGSAGAGPMGEQHRSDRQGRNLSPTRT